MRHLRLLPVLALVGACGTDLPPGTTTFTLGRTVVRTDSLLDAAGVVYQLADSARVAPRGPVRHWLEALGGELGAPVFDAARAMGAVPISLLLETYGTPGASDSACGSPARGVRRCFSGNQRVRAGVEAFLDSVRSFAPRLAPVALENVSADARRRDLADVYVALSTSKSLDSALAAYSGYDDLRFDVTLARTLTPGNTTPPIDPARHLGPERRIFLVPDAVFPTRSFRSPSYIWLALGHQMAHAVVRRMLDASPALLDHGWRLKQALEPEMAKRGYDGVFWEDIIEEQLARAVTIRMLVQTSPTVTWAARSDALNAGMSLVPWFEDALTRYEGARDTYPTLTDFAPVLAAALDSIPLDACRAAPNPGLVLVGVARHRAVVAWLADDSPYRATNVLAGDTVTAIDGDSVSAGGLLVPTRQLTLAWAQHLPFELGILDIRRGGRDYRASAPISFRTREQVRIASQARDAVADSSAVCRWNTRARRR